MVISSDVFFIYMLFELLMESQNIQLGKQEFKLSICRIIWCMLHTKTAKSKRKSKKLVKSAILCQIKEGKIKAHYHHIWHRIIYVVVWLKSVALSEPMVAMTYVLYYLSVCKVATQLSKKNEGY